MVPRTSHLLSLIQTSFYKTSQLHLTLLTPPSFSEVSSQFQWSFCLLVLLQALQLLSLLCRHLYLTFPPVPLGPLKASSFILSS